MYTRVPLISQNVPDWLHNGCHAAIICQSHPKQISEFYLHFWPLAPHIGRAVGGNGKTAQKWPKKYQISKLAENPSKSGKRLKPNAIRQKCPSLCAQKWHFGCPNKNSETTFISPTSPKIEGKKSKNICLVTNLWWHANVYDRFWNIWELNSWQMCWWW